MTRADYTHITIAADRTGSMGDITEAGHTKASDTTTGIHSLLLEQAKLPGKVTFSLVQFMCSWDLHGQRDGFGRPAGHQRNHIDRVAWMASPHDPQWNTLLTWTCAPYGNTPLLDAVGTVITDTGTELAALPEDERPAKVIFVISTDGEENYSTEYTLPAIKAMVTEQREKYGWEFVFIGVDIDAFAEARKMGFTTASTMGTAGEGIGQTYVVTNSAMGRYRSAGAAESFDYSDAAREQVRQAQDTP